ncbi:Bug family tripartite tricarboxylate transporter substrate binding protein [Rhodovarius lipocyclicus]|uniref:Bug family tripartite tricarboxylate transporter substrate binding protein n=1 Tax=Rhodovarius lipocyclicus TaxID=268410 RepID=UPI00135AF6D8|nr:tripartite tricarboxylate transporter substrate-binding protein [Rhodovarius lipocyclicus]
MMLTRRGTVTGVMAAMAAAPAARAQAFPTGPVRLVIGFPPGGTVDTIGRIIIGPIGARLGQPLVIDTRAGASGVLAVENIARSRPDAHSLVMASAGALAVMPHMLNTMPYDVERDLTPVTQLVRTPQLLVVGKHVAANSVQELVAAAKAQPGKLTFGSTGIGSTLHLAGELFKMRAGIDILHVPYRGGAPAVTAMLAGEIDMLLVDIPVVMQHIRNGSFKPLALASANRIGALPDVPTMEQAGVRDVIAEGWYAIYAPPGTPADQVETVRRAVAEGLADPATQRALADLGGVVTTSSPEELRAYARSESVKWGEVVRVSGARAN